MARNVPTPTNQYTPAFNVVDTVAGFNQGDIVYYNNTGDFGRLANNAVTTAYFTYNNSLPFNPSSNWTGGVNNLLASTLNGGFGGANGASNAAKLSNGNIVRVGLNSSNYPYFVIMDTTNTVVVANTQVQAVAVGNTSYPTVSVVALSGGGFAVAWTTSTTTISYAVYTNTGTVTKSGASEAINGFSNMAPVMVALANGGFVIAAGYAQTAANFRTYNASGTAVSAITGSSIQLSSAAPIAIASRSDSSFILVGSDNTAQVIGYAIYNSSGSTLLSPTSFNIGGTSANACVTATVMSDGTTFVIGYANQTGTPVFFPAFRFLPSGNSLQPEISLQSAIQPAYMAGATSNNILNVFSLGVASGNLVFGYTDLMGYMSYAFFNSSGTCVSGFYSGTIPFLRVAFGSGIKQIVQPPTLLEYGSNVNISWNDNSGLNSNFNMNTVAISQTTYSPIPLSLTNPISQGTVSNAVSGVVQSTQSPISGSFYAANTANTYTLKPPATVSATTISSNATLSLDIATLVSGNFVYAWQETSSGSVYANVYTPAGSLVTSLYVGSGISGNLYESVRVSSLTSGKFVVSYFSGSTTVTHVIYTSAYAVSTTFTTINITNSRASALTTQSFATAGISGDRFVLVARISTNSNYLTYYVYSGAGATVAGPTTVISSTSIYNLNVSGQPQSGFAVSSASSSASYMYTYVESSANTFTSVLQSAFSSSNYISTGPMAVSQNGTVFNTYTSDGTTFAILSYVNGATNGQTGQVTGIVCASTGTSYCALGTTAYGELLYVYMPSTTLYVSSSASSGGSLGQANVIGRANFQIASSASTTNCYRLVNLSGRYMVAGYITSSNYPSFTIFNGEAFLSSLSTTAGVTQSDATTISTPVAGIAASTASANTSGVLQTNGACQLNSNYPSTTASTSFSNGVGAGSPAVKGIIVGRNVNLIGNN